MVHDAMEHIILDHTRTAVFGEAIYKHVDNYFEAGKAVKSLKYNVP